MNKINLKKTNVVGVQLSRAQLKKILGGGVHTTAPFGATTTTEDPASSGSWYKCCNYQNCTSCGARSFVASGVTATCPNLSWKCSA